jgi:hypothetical protein
MKTERRNSGDLVDLFVKKLKKEDLPKRDVKAYLKTRETREKLRRAADKLQRMIEEIEAPIYKARAAGAGLSSETLHEIQKKRREAHLEVQRDLHKNPEYWEVMEAAYPPSPTTTPPWLPKIQWPISLVLQEIRGCKNITIEICKERICVEQEIPTTVDFIDIDGDGTLNRIGDDRFQAEDNVGYATDATVTHEGVINIWSGATLVEPTTVLGVGFDLEHPRDANGELIGKNSLCGWGHDPWIGSSDWGRAKGWYVIKWLYKEPGRAWTEDFASAEIKYYDTGKIESYVSCWTVNVLGQEERARVDIQRYNVLPAGTEVLSQLFLIYEIKAVGTEGEAWANYSLRVKPYIKIHACTDDYPESICINVSDWI